MEKFLIGYFNEENEERAYTEVEADTYVAAWDAFDADPENEDCTVFLIVGSDLTIHHAD